MRGMVPGRTGPEAEGRCRSAAWMAKDRSAVTGRKQAAASTVNYSALPCWLGSNATMQESTAHCWWVVCDNRVTFTPGGEWALVVPPGTTSRLPCLVCSWTDVRCRRPQRERVYS